MKRELEPEVMDTVEEALAYDQMDHGEVNRLFVEDLLTAGPVVGEGLDLGTGTALIPLELCRSNEGVRVMAVDMSVSMLDVARNNVELAGFCERVQLDRVDAKRLPYEDNRFGVVMSNSIIHHLAHPERALREAVRVTRAGGLLFFRDLIRPPTEADLDRLVDTYAGEEAEHARQMFRDSLRAALDLDGIRAMIGDQGFDTATVTVTSDRHWTWSARK